MSDLPRTGTMISETGNKCRNPECTKCYPIKEKKPKSLRCRLGFHDAHKKLNSKFWYCRRCLIHGDFWDFHGSPYDW